MTEEEQLALALQMSMAGSMEDDLQPMDTEAHNVADQVTQLGRKKLITCAIVIIVHCALTKDV